MSQEAGIWRHIMLHVAHKSKSIRSCSRALCTGGGHTASARASLVSRLLGPASRRRSTFCLHSAFKDETGGPLRAGFCAHSCPLAPSPALHDIRSLLPPSPLPPWQRPPTAQSGGALRFGSLLSFEEAFPVKVPNTCSSFDIVRQTVNIEGMESEC